MTSQHTGGRALLAAVRRRAEARDVLRVTIAAVALVLVMVAPGAEFRAGGAALATLVLVEMLVRPSGPVRQALGAKGADVLARDLQARTVVVVTLAAAAAPNPGTAAGTLVWTWAAVLVASAAAESPLKAFGRIAPLRVANIPSMGQAPARLQPGTWVLAVAASTAALALAAVAGLVDAPVVAGALGVAGLAGHAVLAVLTLARIIPVARQRAALRAFLADLAPKIAIMHTGGESSASYQIPMWEPHVRAAGLPYIVVARSAATVASIAKLTPAPVICANDSDRRLLDAVMVRSLTLGVFLRNAKENRPYLAYRHMRHIFLNHGDSDKPANFNPMHREFDRVFVCGEKGVERYAEHGVEIPRERFVLVGRPQIADIVRTDRHVSEVSEQRVLYAPTWYGKHTYDRYTSLPVGTEIVAALLRRGATVTFRPHPVSEIIPSDREQCEAIRAMLEADARESGRAHIYGRAAEKDRTVADCINDVDALVSDVSSVTSDFLQSGKPLALVAMTCSGAEFVREFSVARAAYVIERDLSNLDTALEQLLVSDPLHDERERVRVHTLGDFDGHEAHDAFVAAVKALVALGPRPRA